MWVRGQLCPSGGQCDTVTACFYLRLQPFSISSQACFLLVSFLPGSPQPPDRHPMPQAGCGFLLTFLQDISIPVSVSLPAGSGPSSPPPSPHLHFLFGIFFAAFQEKLMWSGMVQRPPQASLGQGLPAEQPQLVWDWLL